MLPFAAKLFCNGGMDRRVFLAAAFGLGGVATGRGPAECRAAPHQAAQRQYRRELRRAVPRRARTDRGGDGGSVAPAARPSFGSTDRDRCRRCRFPRRRDGRGRRQPRHGAVGLSHRRDQPDARENDLRGRRQQPAHLRPRARRPARTRGSRTRCSRRGRCGAAGSAGTRARALSTSIPARCATGRSTATGSTGCCRASTSCLAKSGLPKHIVAGRARRPLNVQERLSLQRAIAKAEFLAKRR